MGSRLLWDADGGAVTTPGVAARRGMGLGLGDRRAFVAEPRFAGDRGGRVVLGRGEAAGLLGDVGDFAAVIFGADTWADDRGFDDGDGFGVDRDCAGFGVGWAG